MNHGLAIFRRYQRFQGGTSTVSDEEYDRQLDADFEGKLRKRRFKPIQGPEFNPRDVPTFHDIDSGQLIFDPKYSSSEDAMYAQQGDEDVSPIQQYLLDVVQRMNIRDSKDLPAALKTPQGPQFNPREVPMMQRPGDYMRYFDPRYGKQELVLEAERGTSNVPLDIFKKRQRLQGGTDTVRFPRKSPPPTLMNTWGDYIAQLIQQAKEDQIDPDMIWNPPTQRPPDEGQRQRLQGGTGDIDPTEVHYASDLPANDPRWNAIAKALGVNVDELKKKNLPSQFEQNYENMAQDLLRRVQERSYGDDRLLNEKQFDPDPVPIRAPYGGQRYFDPASSLGVDPIMAQGGTSNAGFAIFKKRQRLQGGTDKVEPNLDPLPPWLHAGYIPKENDTWVSPSGRKYVASEKEAAGLYSPNVARAVQSALDDEQGHESVPATDEQRKGVYGTIGINVDGVEHEVPLWYEGMPRENAEEAARMRWEWDLSAFAPDSELEAVQNAAHQGPDDAYLDPNSPNYLKPQGHAKGTSNIMQTTANNPGLRLFMQRQQLKRPRPQGYAKGSSGIHIKPSHKGLFTAKAKSAGMGVQQYASKVLSSGSGASAATRKQANFAKNAAKWNH